MEGLGDDFEAFVERLRINNAVSSVTKSSNQQSSNPPHLPQSQLHQLRYTSHPPPTNSLPRKTESSPALSDSSTSMTGSISVEVSMQEAVSSPGLSSVTGAMRMPSPGHRFSSDSNQMSENPARLKAHRRAQSEIAFRLPQELFEGEFGLKGAEAPSLLDDEGEELLSMYLDMEDRHISGGSSNFAIGTFKPVDGNTKPLLPRHARSLSVDEMLAGFNTLQSGSDILSSHGTSDAPRPGHHHGNSVDVSISFKQELLTGDLDSLETRKAMTAEKLTELALLDPKRAKRVLANRQSAARSKERKTRYISELERKVQTLQTEATTLSAQLTVLQRDTTSLTTENSELKLRLQAMEQHAQLHNALNDALKDEVQRLKLATGHYSTANGPAFNISLNQSFSQLPKPSHHLTIQQLQQGHSSLSNNQLAVQVQALTDFIQDNAFGSL